MRIARAHTHTHTHTHTSLVMGVEVGPVKGRGGGEVVVGGGGGKMKQKLYRWMQTATDSLTVFSTVGFLSQSKQYNHWHRCKKEGEKSLFGLLFPVVVTKFCFNLDFLLNPPPPQKKKKRKKVAFFFLCVMAYSS